MKRLLCLPSTYLGLPILLWRHGQQLRTPFNHYAFSPGARADFHAPSPVVDAIHGRTGPGFP